MQTHSHHICILRYNLGFTYKETTGEINATTKETIPGNLGGDCLFIDNIVDKLWFLYQQIAQSKTVVKCQAFIAIARYFELCLKEICATHNTHFQELFFVFIVPNEWSTRKDIMQIVLVPLLQHIGIIFPPNIFDKILLITQLGAVLSFLQLDSLTKQSIPAYIHNENRCILYNIRLESEIIQQKSIYFQLKESYDLKIYNSARFFIPQVISVEESCQHDCRVDFDHILNNLKKLVFQQILNMESLSEIPIQDDSLYVENPTAADLIMNDLLMATIVSVNYNLNSV